jgi:hypothetical protein
MRERKREIRGDQGTGGMGRVQAACSERRIDI